MNRDDIIAMARNADSSGEVLWLNERIPGYEEEIAFIERFAALVAAAEREECAKIVDKWFEGMSSEPEMAEIAAEIRARGNSEKP
jgi:hypothetical protein